MQEKKGLGSKIRKAWAVLGPGLITGASDDDPSGIATYSQAGAGFGLSTLWTALITFPLMAAIQEMCARIGAITSKGLTGVLRDHYPAWVLYTMLVFSFPAIILNIGADIEGMGAVGHMLLPQVPVFTFEILFTGVILFCVIRYPYQRLASILKWLCLTLLLYMIIPFMVKVDWHQVWRHTLIPTIHADKDFLGILVAILGTTISPYLFFWQATMEAEDVTKGNSGDMAAQPGSYPNEGTAELPKSALAKAPLAKAAASRGQVGKSLQAVQVHRTMKGLRAGKPGHNLDRRSLLLVDKDFISRMQKDVYTGMFFSNLVMFFIILTTGVVLFQAGIHKIDTVEQAASALEPLAGKVTYALFAVGVIGTGLLAIPVLGGSLSYIVAETFRWKQGLDKRFNQAPGFYLTLVVSLIAGLCMDFLHISPIKALFYTALLYGLTAPVMIVLVLLVSNNKKIMGDAVNGRWSNIFGVLTLILMTVAAAALIWFQF